jgi:hypothetical protein
MQATDTLDDTRLRNETAAILAASLMIITGLLFWMKGYSDRYVAILTPDAASNIVDKSAISWTYHVIIGAIGDSAPALPTQDCDMRRTLLMFYNNCEQ